MIEELALIFLRATLPIEFCTLKEGERAHDVCARKGEGVFYATIDVALSSKMDDAIDFLFAHQLQSSFKIADIHLDKTIVGLIFYIAKIGQIASLRQFVEIDNAILGIFIDEKAYHMASDEACTARNEDVALVHDGGEKENGERRLKMIRYVLQEAQEAARTCIQRRRESTQ